MLIWTFSTRALFLFQIIHRYIHSYIYIHIHSYKLSWKTISVSQSFYDVWANVKCPMLLFLIIDFIVTAYGIVESSTKMKPKVLWVSYFLIVSFEKLFCWFNSLYLVILFLESFETRHFISEHFVYKRVLNYFISFCVFLLWKKSHFLIRFAIFIFVTIHLNSTWS